MNPLTYQEVERQYDEIYFSHASSSADELTLSCSFSDGATHRGKRMMAVVGSNVFMLDDCFRCIVTLWDEPGWFIAPCYYSDESVVEDIGPFDTLADAMVYMKLRY